MEHNALAQPPLTMYLYGTLKKLLLIVFLALPVKGLFAQTAEDPKVLLELEKKRATAIEAFDEAFLANLYADSYSGVTATGVVNHKEDQLIAFRSRNKFVVFSNEEVAAAVFGNTAVITGKQVTKSKAGSALGLTRYLLVYLKTKDQWKILTGQETVVIK